MKGFIVIVVCLVGLALVQGVPLNLAQTYTLQSSSDEGEEVVVRNAGLMFASRKGTIGGTSVVTEQFFSCSDDGNLYVFAPPTPFSSSSPAQQCTSTIVVKPFSLCGLKLATCSELFSSRSTQFPSQTPLWECPPVSLDFTQSGLTLVNATSSPDGGCSFASFTYNMAPSAPSLPLSAAEVSSSLVPFAGCESSTTTANFSQQSLAVPALSSWSSSLASVCGASFDPAPALPAPLSQLISVGASLVSALDPVASVPAKPLFRSQLQDPEFSYVVPVNGLSDTLLWYDDSGYGLVSLQNRSFSPSKSVAKGQSIYGAAAGVLAGSSAVRYFALSDAPSGGFLLLELFPSTGSPAQPVAQFPAALSFLDPWFVQFGPCIFLQPAGDSLILAGNGGYAFVSTTSWQITRTIRQLGIYAWYASLASSSSSSVLYGVRTSPFGNATFVAVDLLTGQDLPSSGVQLCSDCEISSCAYDPASFILTCSDAESGSLLSIQVQTLVIVNTLIVSSDSEDGPLIAYVSST